MHRYIHTCHMVYISSASVQCGNTWWRCVMWAIASNINGSILVLWGETGIFVFFGTFRLLWNLHLLSLGTKQIHLDQKQETHISTHQASVAPNTKEKQLNLPFSSPTEISKKHRELLFALIIWENLGVKGKITLYWLTSQFIQTHEVPETV